MYDWYMKHSGQEYGIEIPKNITETKIAKIRVCRESSRELILERDFPLEKVPEINNSVFNLTNNDLKNLSRITQEIFDKLNFD
jgi:hypothetical protein